MKEQKTQVEQLQLENERLMRQNFELSKRVQNDSDFRQTQSDTGTRQAPIHQTHFRPRTGETWPPQPRREPWMTDDQWKSFLMRPNPFKLS